MTKEAHTATEVDPRNPPTKRVPPEGIPLPETPEGPVEQAGPVWEGGDPGQGGPQITDPPAVDTTYWPKAEPTESEDGAKKGAKK